VRWTDVTYLALIGVWMVAWLLKVYLDSRIYGLATSGGFAYWTTANVHDLVTAGCG
jgi:hypothetical protein